MTIINTQRNSVHFEEPEADDVFLDVSFIVPSGDGKHSRPMSLGWFPVSGFRGWVSWAVGMADQMERPIYILPLSHNDILRTGRFEPYRELLKDMSKSEWSEMRRLLIRNCLEILRDCDDRHARAEAYGSLVQLVGRPPESPPAH